MSRQKTPDQIPADAVTDPVVSTSATAAPAAPQATETTDAAGGVAAPSAASADLHRDETQSANADPAPVRPINNPTDQGAVDAVVLSPVMLDNEPLQIGDEVLLTGKVFEELSSAGVVEAR